MFALGAGGFRAHILPILWRTLCRVNRRGGAGEVAVEQVHVQAQGDAGIGVPEHPCRGEYVDVCGHGQRCAGVPKSVRRDGSA